MAKRTQKSAKTSSKNSKRPTITPLADRVLIKPLAEEEAERKTDTGIIIPATVSETKEGERGTVVAVGPGKLDSDGNRIPMEVAKGDTVIFQWGEKVTIDGEEYRVVSESNILAILG